PTAHVERIGPQHERSILEPVGRLDQLAAVDRPDTSELVARQHAQQKGSQFVTSKLPTSYGESGRRPQVVHMIGDGARKRPSSRRCRSWSSSSLVTVPDATMASLSCSKFARMRSAPADPPCHMKVRPSASTSTSPRARSRPARNLPHRRLTPRPILPY